MKPRPPTIGMAIALLTATLAAILLIFPASATRADPDCDDVTSENIADHLSPGPGYPLVGFWKNDCEDDFGLAIDRVGNGLYSISFCGPGGCFPPGTYRPNSPIVGDRDYNLIDQDTLEVLRLDGFSTYFRCTPRSSKPSA